MRWFLGLMSLAAACSLTPEEYQKRNIRVACEYIVECSPELGFEDVAACVEFLTEAAVEPDPACVYDEEAARECLELAAQLECPEEGELGEAPEACNDAYDCSYIKEEQGNGNARLWPERLRPQQ